MFFTSSFNNFTHTIALGDQFLSVAGSSLGFLNKGGRKKPAAAPVPNAVSLLTIGAAAKAGANCVAALGEVTVGFFGTGIGAGTVDFGCQGLLVAGAFGFGVGVTGLRGAGAGLGALGLTFGISGQGFVFGPYGSNGFVFGPNGSILVGAFGVVVVPTLGGVAASGAEFGRGRK
jgi:hypothetical protein